MSTLPIPIQFQNNVTGSNSIQMYETTILFSSITQLYPYLSTNMPAIPGYSTNVSYWQGWNQILDDTMPLGNILRESSAFFTTYVDAYIDASGHKITRLEGNPITTPSLIHHIAHHNTNTTTAPHNYPFLNASTLQLGASNFLFKRTMLSSRLSK